MRFAFLPLVAAAVAGAVLTGPLLPRPNGGATASAAEDKPWCAPEVVELSDHVCFFDGGTPPSGTRTLVVYLHGMLATTPGLPRCSKISYAAKRLRTKSLRPWGGIPSGPFAST